MMEVSRIRKTVVGLMPVTVMVAVQAAYAGMSILYKLAAEDGMNLTVLIAYRLMFATAFMLPLALFIERQSRPKLTWMILFQAFLCGFFGGALAQNLFVKSLALTSATFATAMPNLNPGITFIMAVCFGLEKLRLETQVGKAKVLGTLTGIGGAMVFTFYKGKELNIWSTHIHLHHVPVHGRHVASSQSGSGHFVLGSLMSLGSCLSFSFWLIIQAKMNKRYPVYYSSTALMCLMGAIQSVVFALCMERGDWSQWRLGWNIRLLTAAYTGIVTSGVAVTLISWCVHIRGPLFVSIFSPLGLIFVAIAGSLALDEMLHMGSILGAVMIVCGLYMVLWGKSKEMQTSKTPKADQNSELPMTETPTNTVNTQQTSTSVICGEESLDNVNLGKK